MTKFNDFLNEQLKDPEIKEEYDALEPEFAIIQALIDARKQRGITQKELSERTGISQGDISNLKMATEIRLSGRSNDWLLQWAWH